MYTKPINHPQKINFQTLLAAAKADRLCLLSAFDSVTDEPAMLICAVNIIGGTDSCYEFIPIAAMCDTNPYDRYRPPMNHVPHEPSVKGDGTGTEMSCHA